MWCRMATKDIKVGDRIRGAGGVEWVIKEITGNPSGLVYVKREVEDSLLTENIKPIRKEWRKFAEWECDWYCLRSSSYDD